CAWIIYAHRCFAGRSLPAGYKCGALACRQIFLEPARPRVHRDVDHCGVVFSRARRRSIFFGRLVIGLALKSGSIFLIKYDVECEGIRAKFAKVLTCSSTGELMLATLLCATCCA